MNIYEDCLLCENPFPYKCDECRSCIIEEPLGEVYRKLINEPKIYIGSGEDYFQYPEKLLT